MRPRPAPAFGVAYPGTGLFRESVRGIGGAEGLGNILYVPVGAVVGFALGWVYFKHIRGAR